MSVMRNISPGTDPACTVEMRDTMTKTKRKNSDDDPVLNISWTGKKKKNSTSSL